MHLTYYSSLIVAVLAAVQINGEENEWLTLAKNAQNSIKDSVATVKSYGISKEKVNSVTNNAFDGFVKYVKIEVSPILKKLNTDSERHTRIKKKINNWIEELDNMNNGPNSSEHKTENSFYKFENTIAKMVKNAPQFAEKIKSASPEHREELMEIGSFIKEVINKLSNNMKNVESQLQNDKKIVPKKTKP